MSDFSITKLKYVATLYTGNSIPNEKKDFYKEKTIPYIPTKEIDSTYGTVNYGNGLSVDESDGFRIAPENSILMCVEGGSAGKKIARIDRPVAFVNKLCCIYGTKINTDLLYYCVQSKDFQEQFKLNITGLIGGVGVSTLKNLFITMPIKKELSQKIVERLNFAIGRVDELISCQESQIEKLKKYKQSIIYKCTTVGLKKHSKLKECNTEWVNYIPESWRVCRIKDVIYPQQKPVFVDDEIITCFRDGEVTLRRNRREEGYTVSFTEHGYQGVDIGDLVIHGMDAFAGAIGCSDSRGKTTPVVHVCKTNGNNRYFMYYLRSMAYGNILMDLADGVRIRSSDYRNFAKLGVFKIVVPPIEEQNQIVEFLDDQCSKIDSLIAIKQKKIEKLQQYKKSIIYEYVTGKKAVL